MYGPALDPCGVFSAGIVLLHKGWGHCRVVVNKGLDTVAHVVTAIDILLQYSHLLRLWCQCVCVCVHVCVCVCVCVSVKQQEKNWQK